MLSRTTFTSLVLAAALVVSPVARVSADDAVKTDSPKPAASAKPAAPKTRNLEVNAGAIKGNIVGLDGKTPVQGSKIVLKDASGKVVSEVKTDEKGNFDLGEREGGEYQIGVGTASGPLIVKKGARASAMKLVLDPAIALGKKDAGLGKLQDFTAGMGDGALLIGGLAILAFAVALAALIVALTHEGHGQRSQFTTVISQ